MPAPSLLVVGATAFLALVVAVASFASSQSLAGIAENPESSTAGASTEAFAWVILVASVVFFAAALLVLGRARGVANGPSNASPSALGTGPTGVLRDEMKPVIVPASPASDPIVIGKNVGRLSAEERNLFSEIQRRGGSAYQKDLVALGTFSRAKVTRLLDKLEAKGLVVRERHGMTNRIRITDEVLETEDGAPQFPSE